MIGEMTAAHFIFIPAVLLVGVVIGWILGSRAAQDAFAAELRSGEERAQEERKPDRGTSSRLGAHRADARSTARPTVGSPGWPAVLH